MTDNGSTFFTDEEIHKELENLGITISPEIFEKIRQDLIDMVSSDITGSDLSHRDVKIDTIHETDEQFTKHSSLDSVKRSLFQDQSSSVSFSKSYTTSLRNKAFSPRNYRPKSKSSQLHGSSTDVSISTSDLLSMTPNLPNIYENNEAHQTNPKNKSSIQYSSEEERLGTSYKSHPNNREIKVNYKSLPELSNISPTRPSVSKLNEKFPEVQQIEDISAELDSFQIDDSPKIESILGDYRKRLINYKVGNRLRQKFIKAAAAASDSEQEALPKSETSLNSTVIDGKMKRKILRYKDGKPFITEQLVDIPSVFSSSCYPSSFSTTNSFSSDLSFKSNSSTGSLIALSPESTPRSTLSNASKIHTKPPRKKKSDPVAMYNYYKKFWDNFKPPGEKSHQKLRWAVRDKMLDYSL